MRKNPAIRSVATAALVVFALIGCDNGRSESADEDVTVTARGGEIVVRSSTSDLPPTAVAVEWDGNVPACIESEGTAVPVQEEQAEDGRTRLWFIAEVAEGESRTYTPSENADCSTSSFEWETVGENGRRLVIDGIPTIAYVDPSENDDRPDAPTKPFHHVYAPDGSRLLTKGGGGNHPHHHGIFHGYRNIGYKDTTTSTWGGRLSQDHARFGGEWSGPVFGGHEVTIDWIDDEGEVFAEDHRTVRAYRRPDGRVVVDVESEIRTLNGPLELGGDPHHAGLQFRAAQYVYDNAERSSYLRPEQWASFDPNEELNDTENFADAPWNALQFYVDDEPYTVGYLTHPSNPSGGQMSERLYGRFGEYIPGLTVEEDAPVRLRYRFLVSEGHDIDRDQLEREYFAYTALP